MCRDIHEIPAVNIWTISYKTMIVKDSKIIGPINVRNIRNWINLEKIISINSYLDCFHILALMPRKLDFSQTNCTRVTTNSPLSSLSIFTKTSLSYIVIQPTYPSKRPAFTVMMPTNPSLFENDTKVAQNLSEFTSNTHYNSSSKFKEIMSISLSLVLMTFFSVACIVFWRRKTAQQRFKNRMRMPPPNINDLEINDTEMLELQSWDSFNTFNSFESINPQNVDQNIYEEPSNLYANV